MFTTTKGMEMVDMENLWRYAEQHALDISADVNAVMPVDLLKLHIDAVDLMLEDAARRTGKEMTRKEVIGQASVAAILWWVANVAPLKTSKPH